MGGDRTDTSTASRLLAVVAVVFVLLGSAVFASSVLASSWLGSGAARAIVDVTPALAEVPPSTVPPRNAATPSAPLADTSSSAPTTATTTTVATTPTSRLGSDPRRDGPDRSTVAHAPPTPSPQSTYPAPTADPVLPTTTVLRDLLDPIDRGAALPADVEPRPLPVGLQTSTIDVSRYPIRSVGLDDDGQLEIPDETEIGWYRYGSTAGRSGATVLAAHVSWNGTTGPFFELGTLDPGAQIEVALDDGTTRLYEVIERAKYDKNELPRERIWRNTGPETLVLITCGGDFNPEIRRYRHNIVVYAVPIG